MNSKINIVGSLKMVRFKTSCLKCKKEIQNFYFAKHNCKTALSMACGFCGKLSKNLNSATQHLIRCGDNPNKIDLSHLNNGENFKSYNNRLQKGQVEHLNQFTKAAKLGLPKPKVSEKVSASIKQANRNRVWDDSARRKHSVSMKKAVENNPDSYTSSNRGRTKQIIYDGKKFQGNWELQFYKWCEANNVVCDRNSKGFNYEWNGTRTYYPDFYIPSYNVYVEVKGYKTGRDIAKWKQFPHKLCVIEKEAISKLKKGLLDLSILDELINLES